MMKKQITDLNYAILGLLLEKPLTGYQLRKVFETTAMNIFSDSPGSIYPALRKLAQEGYLQTVVKASKKHLMLAPLGKETLKKWVMNPLVQEDISKKMDVQLLKYVFAELLLTEGQKKQFLQRLTQTLEDYVEKLKVDFKMQSAHMTRHGKQAFQLGIATFQLQLKWVKNIRR